MKKFRVIPLLLVLCLLCSCVQSGETADLKSGYIEITDSVGRTVQVPSDPQSISCVCPFTGSLIVMFGKGDKLTTSCNNVVRSVLLDLICPGISDVTVAKGSGSVNAETILKMNTDIVFIDQTTWQNDDERAKLEALNIPVVVVGFQTIEEQMAAVKVVGAALGANEEAEKYVSWYRQVIDSVSSTCDKIPETQKIRLYHSVNEAVRTDYTGSICAEWIALTGVTNVSLTDSSKITVEGEKAYTTLEQIYVWNPDIIICNEAGVNDYILTDEKWAGLDCVKSGKVYQMPVGVARMGHPTSSEIPLALLWLAELIYPDQFNIDFGQEVYDYYLEFYDYTLTDEMIDCIIKADDMRTAKAGNKLE